MAAIDARTGETRWTYSLNEGTDLYAPGQNSGRGVAYWKNKNGADRVVYITPTYQLIALDAQTGLPVAVLLVKKDRRPPSTRTGSGHCSDRITLHHRQ
ncbi:MAG: hypothetical protein IPG82_10190 [Saprospiraceae bacterium]|nr:hypothetical protein [Saprospiraceae bacterium]